MYVITHAQWEVFDGDFPFVVQNMATRSTSGGYNYDFFDNVPDRFNCPICAKPFRDPHLVVCCGKHYCASCLTEWFMKRSGWKNCPHCRTEGKKFTHVINKGLKSEVEELKIYCSNRDKGCEWVGQLGDFEAHRTSERGCGYEKVPCPNKCQESTMGTLFSMSKSMYLYRKDLTNHLANQCINRPYRCEYCHKKGLYEEITRFHYSVCPEYPISCPNQQCHVNNIKRKGLNDHLKVCPEEQVDCPFAEAGCTKRVRRCRLDDHMTSNVQEHLLVLMGAYKEVKRRLEELEDQPKRKKAKYYY